MMLIISVNFYFLMLKLNNVIIKNCVILVVLLVVCGKLRVKLCGCVIFYVIFCVKLRAKLRDNFIHIHKSVIFFFIYVIIFCASGK